jgi:hypothetical protein
MRDHQAQSAAIRARYRAARRRVAGVVQVIAVPRLAVQRQTVALISHTGGSQINVAAHIHLSATHTALRCRPHDAPRTPGPPQVHRSVDRGGHPSAARQRFEVAAAASVFEPAAMRGRAQRRSVDAMRAEQPVHDIERVVPHSTLQPAVASASEGWSAATPARDRAHTSRSETRPLPSAAELDTITTHVLTAIDRRLIAHNERLGRG